MRTADGRTVHAYDTGPAGAGLTVVWHHGTPNTGDPPGPLLDPAARRGIRWVSLDRPGYGGSDPLPGRDVAAVAGDVAEVADALGVETFAVVGHSGGGPHALACAAALPDRVRAAVSISGLAPFDAPGLDWFAGMHPGGAAELRAAVDGRAALLAQLGAAGFDPEQFTPADHAALAGPWSWLLTVVERAQQDGPGPMADDDLAYVASWGCDPADAAVPVLLVHGGADRVVPAAHGAWLAGQVPGARLWARPDDGHLSVLDAGVDALDWLLAATG